MTKSGRLCPTATASFRTTEAHRAQRPGCSPSLPTEGRIFQHRSHLASYRGPCGFLCCSIGWQVLAADAGVHGNAHGQHAVGLHGEDAQKALISVPVDTRTWETISRSASSSASINFWFDGDGEGAAHGLAFGGGSGLGGVVRALDDGDAGLRGDMLVEYFAKNSPVEPTVDNNWKIVGIDLQLDNPERAEISVPLTMVTPVSGVQVTSKAPLVPAARAATSRRPAADSGRKQLPLLLHRVRDAGRR